MEQPGKNSIHTVTIEGYSSDGSGIARLDGMVVFVKNAIRGELCEIKLLKVLKNVAYGKIERVIAPSEHRVEPACPVFGKCGGCDLLHMDYAEELNYKKSRVQDALARLGGLTLTVSAIHGAEKTEGYRNKAIYAVGRDEHGAYTGFYRERSHDVMKNGSCLIQAEVSARAAGAVTDWMDAFGVPPYDEKTGRGAIRHVFCRAAFGTGRTQVVIVSAIRKLPDTGALVGGILAACPEASGIILNVNKTPGNTVLSGELHTLWGDDRLEDTLCGLRFRLSPLSFYQVNRAQAEKLYALAVDFAGLTGTETALDLYCGTGTISLCLAKRAGQVIGAEIVPEAIEDARKNAELNGIENARFICADAAEAAKRLLEEGIRPDTVVVDPPRKGLAAAVPGIIAGMEPRRVVYVSCDPATLARDLKAFTAHGYEAVKAEAVDMFPRCAHVETVCLLSKLHAEHHIDVELDLSEMDLTAAESKATYEEIKAYVLDKTGINISTLNIAQVKRKCGIIERDNYNHKRAEESKQPHCTPEKEAAIIEVLRNFSMI